LDGKNQIAVRELNKENPMQMEQSAARRIIAAYAMIKPAWQIKKSVARIIKEENRKDCRGNSSDSSATSYS